LPAVIRHGLQVSFSDSLHVVFLSAVPFAILAFVLALLLREIPLRTSMGTPEAGATPEPLSAGTELGEAFGMQPATGLNGSHESLSPTAVDRR
jgi:hypothetical protein